MEKEITKLNVSEVFTSIQGEGQTMGVPAVFLRLGGCNLLCESKSWVCDTIEVWRKSKATLFDQVLSEEQENYVCNPNLTRNAHLVITGGEPLMHQKAIIAYLKYLQQKWNNNEITVEIETNGTIIPDDELLWSVDYWNVSPKLSNAGEQNKREIRVNGVALMKLSSRKHNTIFKFVIEKESDILEVFEDFSKWIKTNQIVLMPAGSSQDELSKTRPLVAEICREKYLRYSDRLHIVIWNQKTGV